MKREHPRVTVRLAPEDFVMLEAASRRSGFAVGALIRECVRRSCSDVADEVVAGRVPARRVRRAAKSAVVIPPGGPERAEFFRRLAERRP